MIFSDHFVFSQEYILKGVVNAALGQEIVSVSICVKLEEFHASECGKSMEQMCLSIFSEGSFENCAAVLSVGRMLGE